MKRILCSLILLVLAVCVMAQSMTRAEVISEYSRALACITKGERRYSEALDIMDRISKYADEDLKRRIMSRIPTVWYMRGMQYQLSQQYDSALVCMEKAREGFKKQTDSKNELKALCQIGGIKFNCYDLYGASAVYSQAAELAKSIRDDANLMGVLTEQYKISEQLGNSERTSLIWYAMDSVAHATDDSQVKFAYYNRMGDDAKWQGSYTSSKQWYRRNEDYINSLGNDYAGADKHTYYSKLRNLFVESGEYDKALYYATLSKNEFNKVTKDSDKNHYMPYMSIADIYCRMGDSLKCFKSLDTLFLALDKLDEPREIQYLYITRARCLSAFKNYIKAFEDYKAADRLLASKYPMDDGDRVKLQALMGGLAHRLKNNDESERLYKQYANGMRRLRGENSDDYINAIYYLANAEGFAGHINDACKHYTYSVESTKKQILQRLPYYTTTDREAFWNSKADLLRNTTAFAVKAGMWQTDFTKICYDALVLSKSFLLESERTAYDVIKANGTTEDLHDVALIAAMQAKIKKWELDYQVYADSILNTGSKVAVLEKRLYDRCRKYGDMTAFMNVGYDKVKRQLQNDEVLIDFTDYVTESRGRVYAAYVIDKAQKCPLLKELFEERVIDSLKVPQPDMYYSQSYGKELFHLLWEPFKNDVKEGATVYYVPSQLLFQIALESLPMEDGTLLGEHYNFVRLSSAREIVRYKSHFAINVTSKKPQAVLYGGLTYDVNADAMKEEAVKYNINKLLATRGDIVRGDSIYRELPETWKEVNGIDSVLRSKRLVITKYTGKRGTEESFLNMSSKAPQILHVATHGFYYTPDAAQKIDYLKGNTDAMSLSGLVLSGGNSAWRGKELPEGVLGGILTATNISRLDLSGIQLTVLSACQTGQGKATPEGLFGLQRAFKKAGVQTLVMTLWNVSDVVTKEFMIKLYENLANNGWNKHKALNDTKAYIRARYKDPYYWAGFVMLD